MLTEGVTSVNDVLRHYTRPFKASSYVTWCIERAVCNKRVGEQEMDIVFEHDISPTYKEMNQ